MNTLPLLLLAASQAAAHACMHAAIRRARNHRDERSEVEVLPKENRVGDSLLDFPECAKLMRKFTAIPNKPGKFENSKSRICPLNEKTKFIFVFFPDRGGAVRRKRQSKTNNIGDVILLVFFYNF